MEKKWYKESVVYQIYPQSFKDSNDDGIGDLQGIIEKIPYLVKLGVSIVWLSPIYASPMDDNGYDISDYCAINPIYGTMDDFKQLIKKLNEANIRLIMDLVVNHTSDEHPWFKTAIADKNSKYHDYYFFKQGKKAPNKWSGFFGGPVWEYVPELDEAYLHLFSKKQVDLNWDNPEVREEIKKVLKFWLDLGVHGFRCDVINIISKREGLPEGKIKPILRGSEHYINGPHVHEYLQELKRDVLSHYDCFTVGESVFITPEKALDYIAYGKEELNMLFQFDHMASDNIIVKWFIRKFKPYRLKKAMSKWQQINGKAWNALYFENHDQPRSASRFGNLKYYEKSTKMLAAYLFLQQGTPFIFQGQEIGMISPNFQELEQYKDVESKNIYNLGRKKLHFSHKSMMKRLMKMSRDNARTPMQWDDSKNAGFSKGKTWIDVASSYKEINVKTQIDDSNSIFSFYQQLIQLRKTHEVIVYGDYIEYLPKNHHLICFKRTYQNKELYVMINYSAKTLKTPKLFNLKNAKLIVNNYDNDELLLQPYQIKAYLKTIE